tara:strand:- start:77 stop:565 length:489 start_codon:yes stop_codon:yes gene_type:complete
MGVFSFVKPGKKAFEFVKDKTGVITGVKPNLKKTVKQTKTEEYRKRYTALGKAEDKLKAGKKMMKEAQQERKKMVDTGKAFQFKHSKSYHAIEPGQDVKKKYKGLLKERKAKGGRVGLKGGGDLGMQSVKYGLDNKPEVTKLDRIAKFIAKDKNKKSKKKII